MTSTAAAKLASSSSASSYTVAVLGGGVAGCAAARRLAELAAPSSSSSSSSSPSSPSSPSPCARVSLYEMGRGPGGRASTRRTRSAPHAYVNHGAPYADVRSSVGRSLMASLGPKCVAPFSGIRGSLDPRTGSFTPDGDDEEEEAGSVDYVTGANGEMSQIASSMIADMPSIRTEYKTMVRHLTRNASNGQWELRDKSRQIVGSADWLIVAGSGVAHPRWSDTFGGVPPLVAAEGDRPDPRLRETLDAIATQQTSPRMAVFFVCSGEAARRWSSLGFAAANVEDGGGGSVLSRVMIQGGRKENGEEWCSVALHSTEDFAVRNSGVYGASSTAARVGGAASDASLEKALVEEMTTSLGDIPGMPPVGMEEIYDYGPALHRWGNAFPKGEPLREDLAFVPTSRIAFAGDYVASSVGARFGSFESALLSGTFAGEKIAKYCEEG